MPHDKKGRLIEVGDHVKFKTWDGNHRLSVGRVFSVTPGADTCNISVVHLTPGYWPISQAAVTAKEAELVLKADGSEPAVGSEAGFSRLGALVATALLALATCAVAPAFAQDPVPPAPAPAAAKDPACGTKEKPQACFSLTTGAVTIGTRDQRREYAAVGAAFDAPIGSGFAVYGTGDMFAVQDGAGTESGLARTFRVVKLDAGATYDAGAIQFVAHGGVTYSIEGEIGAPIDPRQWDALVDVRLLIGAGGHVALRGGHDGAVGGWAAGADLVIPVSDGPAIVARYEIPLQRDPTGRVPWVITAGGRIRVASFRLRK